MTFEELGLCALVETAIEEAECSEEEGLAESVTRDFFFGALGKANSSTSHSFLTALKQSSSDRSCRKF